MRNTFIVMSFTKISHLFSVSDAISESNPRVIDDTRARKLANDLKRCSYYETCATYGLNVERVFQDGEEFFLFMSFCYSGFFFFVFVFVFV